MKTYFKIEVFKLTHFWDDKSHKSIRGGIATHSFYKIYQMEADNLNTLLKKIKDRYGEGVYIFDDRLELQVSETETLSFYISKVSESNYFESDLIESFPNLER